MADLELMAVHINSADLYKTGHMANRWFRGLMDQLAFNVAAAAPKRTGNLAAGIDAFVVAAAQAHHLDGTLSSEADYTLFVLRGTKTPILSRLAYDAGAAADPEVAYQMVWGWVDPRTKRFHSRGAIPADLKARGVRRKQHPIGRKGFFMGVRPKPYSRYNQKTPRLMVRGQEAENFLLTGWKRTARSHAAMRRTPTFILHP